MSLCVCMLCVLWCESVFLRVLNLISADTFPLQQEPVVMKRGCRFNFALFNPAVGRFVPAHVSRFRSIKMKAQYCGYFKMTCGI